MKGVKCVAQLILSQTEEKKQGIQVIFKLDFPEYSLQLLQKTFIIKCYCRLNACTCGLDQRQAELSRSCAGESVSTES